MRLLSLAAIVSHTTHQGHQPNVSARGADRVNGATGYEKSLRCQYVDRLLWGNEMSLAFPRWRAVTGALVLALCLLMLSGAASHAQAACGPGDFVPHQVIVKLNPIPGATVEQINATYGSTTLETFPGSTDVYLLELPTGSDVTETVKQMANDPRLIYAEPNFFAQPPEGGARHRAWGVSDVAPTSEEYAAQALGLVSAHAISQGEGTTVAVVDTGAQLDHPALVDNFGGSSATTSWATTRILRTALWATTRTATERQTRWWATARTWRG